jgi:hypothetical protein
MKNGWDREVHVLIPYELSNYMIVIVNSEVSRITINDLNANEECNL